MAADRAWEVQGEVVDALRQATAHLGDGVLSDPRVLENVLSDLLPDAPTQARLLVLAAKDDLAGSLRQLCQHVDTAEAVRLAGSRFVDAYSIEPQAAVWAATVLATTMGYELSSPPNLAAAPEVVPAPGPAPWEAPGVPPGGADLARQATVDGATPGAGDGAGRPRAAPDPAPAPAPAPPPPQGRRTVRLSAVIAAGVVVALAAGGGAAFALFATRRPVVVAPLAATTTSVPPPSTTTTAPAPTTTTTATTATPTTVRTAPTSGTAINTTPSVDQTAELQSGWIHDPTKCGPEPTDQSHPYSATHTYQVTATIHLWSAPTTSSTPLAEIPVSTNGAGGIGCASGHDPTVTVTCATQGQPITGPFGTDARWDKTTYDGRDGFLPDEWVDTKWDASSLPAC